MKKLIVLLLFAVSCEQSYQYIEVVKTNDGVEEEIKEFESKNDSTAYFDGYLMFYISKRHFEKNKKEYGDKENFDFYFDKPIKFKVINENGDNLSLLPDYKDREQSEERIRKVVDGMTHLQ